MGSVKRAAHEVGICDKALVRAFGFLGKRWNGIILSVLTLGSAGFTELKRGVGGISDSVLSERLSELGQAGLVLRSVEEGPPIAVLYSLTASGQALQPAMDELRAWAVENLPEQACEGQSADI